MPEAEALAALERLARTRLWSRRRAPRCCCAPRTSRQARQLGSRAAPVRDARAKTIPISSRRSTGFVPLLRDRGAARGRDPTLLVNARGAPGARRGALALADRRRRLLRRARRHRLGEAAVSRSARRRSGEPQGGGMALVELCWDTGSLVELVPILDELCRTTDDPGRAARLFARSAARSRRARRRHRRARRRSVAPSSSIPTISRRAASSRTCCSKRAVAEGARR